MFFLMVPPLVCGGNQGGGGLPLLILIHRVHSSPSLVEIANFLRLSILVNGAIGVGSLADIDMVHNIDASIHGKVY